MLINFLLANYKKYVYEIRMKRFILNMLIFLVFVFLFFLQSLAFSFTISKVRLLKKTVYDYIPAEVISKKAVTISSKIPGFVENLHVDIGNIVKKGEILLTIDQNVSKQNIKQALANVSKAKAQLKNAKFNYEKFVKLYKEKAISRQQFLNMKTNYQTSLGAYEQSLAALKTAQSTLRYSIIKSPVDGIISDKYVNDGDMASMFQPLLKISEINSLQIRAYVDSTVSDLIEHSRRVVVKIKDKTLKLNVSNISPSLDPITRTREIKIKLPKTINVSPGEFAYVIIGVKSKNFIVVDKRAQTTRGGIDGVFVVDKKGRANFRMVKFGNTYKQYIISLSGLFPNEVVVLNPSLSLKNGSVVVNEKH